MEQSNPTLGKWLGILIVFAPFLLFVVLNVLVPALIGWNPLQGYLVAEGLEFVIGLVLGLFILAWMIFWYIRLKLFRS